MHARLKPIFLCWTFIILCCIFIVVCRTFLVVTYPVISIPTHITKTCHSGISLSFILHKLCIREAHTITPKTAINAGSRQRNFSVLDLHIGRQTVCSQFYTNTNLYEYSIDKKLLTMTKHLHTSTTLSTVYSVYYGYLLYIGTFKIG